MARLERGDGTSRDAGAYISKSVFAELGASASAVGKYCTDAGAELRVMISPAAFDYLETISPSEQDRQIVRALAFAYVNDRDRVWATDFALLAGAHTEDAVREWYASRRITPRAAKLGGLLLPDDDGRADDIWAGTAKQVAPSLSSQQARNIGALQNADPTTTIVGQERDGTVLVQHTAKEERSRLAPGGASRNDRPFGAVRTFIYRVHPDGARCGNGWALCDECGEQLLAGDETLVLPVKVEGKDPDASTARLYAYVPKPKKGASWRPR